MSAHVARHHNSLPSSCFNPDSAPPPQTAQRGDGSSGGGIVPRPPGSWAGPRGGVACPSLPGERLSVAATATGVGRDSSPEASGLMTFRNSFTCFFVTFGCAGSSVPWAFLLRLRAGFHCSSSCRCAVRALGQAGCVAAARGLSGFGSWAQGPGLRSCGAQALLCRGSGIFRIRDRTLVSCPGPPGKHMD